MSPGDLKRGTHHEEPEEFPAAETQSAEIATEPAITASPRLPDLALQVSLLIVHTPGSPPPTWVASLPLWSRNTHEGGIRRNEGQGITFCQPGRPVVSEMPKRKPWQCSCQPRHPPAACLCAQGLREQDMSVHSFHMSISCWPVSSAVFCRMSLGSRAFSRGWSVYL